MFFCEEVMNKCPVLLGVAGWIWFTGTSSCTWQTMDILTSYLRWLLSLDINFVNLKWSYRVMTIIILCIYYVFKNETVEYGGLCVEFEGAIIQCIHYVGIMALSYSHELLSTILGLYIDVLLLKRNTFIQLHNWIRNISFSESLMFFIDLMLVLK